MDLAFSRYANPMILFNQMIRTRRLAEFVNELLAMHNKETEEQAAWDYWLHRIYDMTYPEFLSRITAKSGTEPTNALSEQELESIVMDSWGTLNSFCPD